MKDFLEDKLVFIIFIAITILGFSLIIYTIKTAIDFKERAFQLEEKRLNYIIEKQQIEN